MKNIDEKCKNIWTRIVFYDINYKREIKVIMKMKPFIKWAGEKTTSSVLILF